MSAKFAGVKGMNDLLAPDIGHWHRLESVAREVFGAYGFDEVRTPVVEDTALFVRSVGEASEIVGKEMYTFKDKGDRSLSLRPEGTAPAARAYIEHAVAQKEPVTRWFYMGPMFRYERMKTGRYRQFHQLGAEVYGAGEPSQDVEVMELAVHFLHRLGLSNVSLQINSLGVPEARAPYVAKVAAHFSAHEASLSAEAKATLVRNPLRLLDSKDEALQALIATAPAMVDFLDPASKEHFDEVQRLLKALDVGFSFNPRLVRGLDYYTRTAFELVAPNPELGTASTVCGGGRYDNLLGELGGPKIPAFGFAMGLERLCIAMGAAAAASTKAPVLFIATADATAKDEALKLATSLRHQGFKVDIDARFGSLKSQMKRADKSLAHYALVLGERELAQGKAQLKPMRGGGEPRDVVLAQLAQALAPV